MSTVASVSNGGCASARTAPAGGSVSRFACTPQAVLAQRQAINRDVVASAAPEESNQLKIFVDVAKKSTAALAAAITIGLSEPAFGADQALRLPISGNKEIAQVQEVMLETWSVVGDAFFDSSALVRFSAWQTVILIQRVIQFDRLNDSGGSTRAFLQRASLRECCRFVQYCLSQLRLSLARRPRALRPLLLLSNPRIVPIYLSYGRIEKPALEF